MRHLLQGTRKGLALGVPAPQSYSAYGKHRTYRLSRTPVLRNYAVPETPEGATAAHSFPGRPTEVQRRLSPLTLSKARWS